MGKFRNNKNFWAACILLLISVIFGVQMLNIKNETDIKFPLFVLGVLSVLFVILVIRIIGERFEVRGKLFTEAKLQNVGIGILAIILFVVIYSKLGFFTTAFLVLNPLSLLIDPNFEKTQTIRHNAVVAAKTIVVNFIILVVVYVGFCIFLKVPTPKGILI